MHEHLSDDAPKAPESGFRDVGRGLLRAIAPIWCEAVRQTRYLFIIKAILKDSKVVVCWIVKAFARTSASSS
jgi:hypothetical protein